MTGTFTYKIIQSKIEGLNFPLFIKYRIEDRKSNVNDLEKKLETGRGFLYNSFKKYDPLVSILVTMSIELQYNLFEPFLSLLPEPIRLTRKEKQLQEEIINLKKELENMTMQRDLLLKVATKGGS